MPTGAVKKVFGYPRPFIPPAPDVFCEGAVPATPRENSRAVGMESPLFIGRGLFKARVQRILDVNIALNRIK